MLLHRDIPGLIEVTDAGARIKLQRDFKLNLKEMQTIGYSTSIPGTAWNLVDIPASGLFHGVKEKFQYSALLVMLAFLAVSAIMLVLLYYTHAKNKRLKYLYTHDLQTGLPNRYLLIEQLQQLISRAQRRNIQFSLLFIELSGLKKANTSFFDRANINELLKIAGNHIKDLLSPDDTLAHLTGHEFAVLLTGASEAQAAHIAESIRMTFGQPAGDTNVTSQKISIGIAVYPEDGKDFEALIQRANISLHAAKRQQSIDQAN